MRLRVELHGTKDIDLIMLHRHPVFDVGVAIKQAVTAYVYGTKTQIPVPGTYTAIEDEELKETYLVSVSFNDNDVVSWLREIQSGCRTTVIKTILRNYLEEPYIRGLCGKQIGTISQAAFQQNRLVGKTAKGGKRSKKPRNTARELDGFSRYGANTAPDNSNLQDAVVRSAEDDSAQNTAPPEDFDIFGQGFVENY